MLLSPLNLTVRQLEHSNVAQVFCLPRRTKKREDDDSTVLWNRSNEYDTGIKINAQWQLQHRESSYKGEWL